MTFKNHTSCTTPLSILWNSNIRLSKVEQDFPSFNYKHISFHLNFFTQMSINIFGGDYTRVVTKE